jgi:dTDP-4-dehydrorhamnose reductase
MTKVVLITGSSGRLGRYVKEIFSTDKNYAVLSPAHQELDVTKREEVFLYIDACKPDVIIHLAAATSPPKCESNKEWAWKTNVVGTINLIDACEKYIPDCYFILMSTPCVFSGEEGNYDENSIPYPQNFYGFTKVIQEIIVMRSKLRFLIIRGNFVPYEKWPYPKAFVDRFGTYLFAHQLAKGIKEVVEANLTGLVHIVGNKKISMYELAKRCPDSETVAPYTLEKYYMENPNSCKLTKDMSLISIRWKAYNIDEE